MYWFDNEPEKKTFGSLLEGDVVLCGCGCNVEFEIAINDQGEKRWRNLRSSYLRKYPVTPEFQTLLHSILGSTREKEEEWE